MVFLPALYAVFPGMSSYTDVDPKASRSPSSFTAITSSGALSPNTTTPRVRVPAPEFWLPGALAGRYPPASARGVRKAGSTPGLGRSSGEEKGNPLQHSFLENLMVRGSRWAIARGIAKSRTQLKQLSTDTSKPSPALVICYFEGRCSLKDTCCSGDKAELKEILKRSFLYFA